MSKSSITRARELRRTATRTEQRAWHLLRDRRLEGFKFRRQHPIGGYVVDFCCARRRLIIELDGGAHSQPSQVVRDMQRQANLERLGYKVLRLPNGLVQKDPDAFVGKVVRCVSSLPDAHSG